MDPSYADAASRRAGRQAARTADGSPLLGGPGLPRRVVAVVVLVAVGLVTGVAAAQVRHRAATGNTVRTELVAQVHQRTAESDQLAGQVDRLREQVAQEQRAALRTNAAGAALDRELADLELASGVDPVTGPGLVVRLDDAPGAVTAAGRGGQPDPGRVLDRDLQDAANGLWSAGAEAIAVNGLRLTALTAIRSAGEAILVDLRPLSPPYTLSAIGNPGRLDAGFADSAAGRRLATYTSLYGIGLAVHRSSHLRLPGAGSPVLHFAVPPAAAGLTGGTP